MAHPGVKSLLARFENNQQTTAPPPPRDRSPAGSDNLSKVRASFVAVEGGSPGPALGLRRVSPQSEGMPSPSRVKSFSSDDLDGSVKSKDPTNGLGTPQKVNEPEKDTKDTVEAKGKEETPAKENQPASTSPTVAPAKTKTVAKKPLVTAPTKSTQAASKASSQSRTPAATKTENEKPKTRISRPSTTTTTVKNDSAKAPVHKSSRPSLATTNKAPTKPAVRETTRSTARSSDVRSSSTARPARPANSATTTKSSATTLSRKPSSLKSATGTRQRAITPSASSVRKPASRSPPSGSDRSNSRASTVSKPVDEGFLARMMRPTASSASKTHEKLDIKSPPRTKVARAPRRIPSTRSTQSTKEKVVSQKPVEVEEQPVDVQVGSEQKTVQETTPEPTVVPSAQAPAVESDIAEAVEAVTELAEPVVVPTDSKSNESDVTPTTEQDTDAAMPEPAVVEEQVEPAEATEPFPEYTEEKTLAPAAEIVEKPTETANATKTAEANAIVAQEKPDITSENPVNSNELDVDDVDLSKWSLNDDDDTF
ncbi:hypothetical protein BDW74DRAFT_15961 [Aspergillus multicolor]|uniref:uncharacterized protein n=1 Tax=Aspergillus multicolor TaxID=41759 RepID=UPI003CCDCB6E